MNVEVNYVPREGEVAIPELKLVHEIGLFCSFLKQQMVTFAATSNADQPQSLVAVLFVGVHIF